MTEYKLFIDGQWIAEPQQEYFPAINPFTQEAFARVPQAPEAQVKQAIDAARRAFQTTWGKTSGVERARLLNRLADLLHENADRMGILESTDNCKGIRESR